MLPAAPDPVSIFKMMNFLSYLFFRAGNQAMAKMMLKKAYQGA